MNLKLDENLEARTRQVFLNAGHDVQTVRDEQLQGRPDEVIIAILRPSRGLSIGVLAALARELVAMIASTSIEGQVWIIEPGRIRIHQSLSEDQP